jgi:hypothetical protein
MQLLLWNVALRLRSRFICAYDVSAYTVFFMYMSSVDFFCAQISNYIIKFSYICVYVYTYVYKLKIIK